MTKRLDRENWRRVQQEALISWMNSYLKGSLKTTAKEVSDLQTDLKDGTVLASLLNNLVVNVGDGKKTKVTIHNSNPTVPEQMRENLTAVFEFMKEENIKLVNIGPNDIMEGKLKVILGLLWTLIRNYQIRSTGKGLPTKKAMLAWINEEVPGLNIKNFTTDWNDGIALCKLIDHIKPGACSDCDNKSSSQGLLNCTLGIKIAHEELGIPQIIRAEHLNHSHVDEVCVMTYVSYFCKLAAEKLLAWVNGKIPQQGITNFVSDWNNGINFGALIEALCPGLFPDYNKLDPDESIANLKRVIKTAEVHMGIEPVVSAETIADPCVDQLIVIIYLLRFHNSKPAALPMLVKAVGPGLVKGFVGQRTYFNVDATQGGPGSLSIDIVTRGVGKLPYELISVQDGIYKCVFIPSKSGKSKIHVLWNGKNILGSPYTTTFIDTGGICISSPQISGGKYGKLGQLVEIVLTGLNASSGLEASLEHSNGEVEKLSTTFQNNSEFLITYIPTVVGCDRISIHLVQKEQEVPGSPFEIHVVDLSKCHITLANHSLGKPFLLGNTAEIVIEALGAGLETVCVEAKTSTGLVPIAISKGEEAGLFFAKYTPVEVGAHSILASCDEDTVLGNPTSLTVVNPREVVLSNSIPRFLQKYQIVDVQIAINNAGPGKLESVSFNSDVVEVTLEDQIDGNVNLKLESFNCGSAEVTITWSGYPLLNMPCIINVCDASNVIAYGAQIDESFGIVGEIFAFKVKASNAGKGCLHAFVRGPTKVYTADIVNNADQTFDVSFVPYETGSHIIDVTWGDELISNAPISVTVALSYASKFTVTGESLTSCIATQAAEFSVVGPESGLVTSGALDVRILNDENKEVEVTVLDASNGSYTVSYTVPSAGEYSICLTCSDEHILGSPYKLIALPPPSPQFCHAFGKAITHSGYIAVGGLLELAVDCTAGGIGSLAVVAFDPTMTQVPVSVEEDPNNQKIHHIIITPKFQGKYIVEVKWEDEHILDSPFTFDVGDPSHAVVSSVPDCETYTAKVRQKFVVIVDKSKAGYGKLDVCLKFSEKSIQVVEVDSEENGICTFFCVPQSTGMAELDIKFCGINIMPKPWKVEVVDPCILEVIPPEKFGKQGHHVKFTVSGLGKKDIKHLMIKALHKDHDATVKLEVKKDGTAVARFTAKYVGCYTISVTCALEHVNGSPFVVNIVNPELCTIKDGIPSCLAVGYSTIIDIDTSRCGPGELEYLLKDDELTDRVYLECNITTVSPSMSTLALTPISIGFCELTLQWAGFNVIEDVPISVVDINKCVYRCPQNDGKRFVKQNDLVDFFINTALCGDCSPSVDAHGPQAVYETDVIDLGSGSHQASFVAWQPGMNSVQISIAGQTLPICPIEFLVAKATKATDITVTGSLTSLSNNMSTLTIHALESDLLARGQLSYQLELSYSTEESSPLLECTDNKDGTYELSYIAYVAGIYSLEILYEGSNISGSPFNIQVVQEPRADKCKALGNALEPGVTVTCNAEAMFLIDSTAAGHGTLSVSGTRPDKKVIRVFVNEEKNESETLHYLMFNTSIVGIYNINVAWDDTPIPGSPFQITVVDPSCCKVTTDIPLSIQIGASEIVVVECTNAGPGNFMAKVDDNSILQAVTGKLVSEDKHKLLYRVSLLGKCIGDTSVSFTFGGKIIENTPFTSNVIDTSLCHMDCHNVLQNDIVVGTSFQFSVISQGAGKSTLTVKPIECAESKFSVEIQSMDDVHTVLCTPWTIGAQSLQVMYGNLAVPGSPVSFTVSDPSKCEIVGLPDPNSYVALMGQTIEFSVDTTEAGIGKLVVLMQQGDMVESVSYDEHDGVATVSYTPHNPGNLELTITYSSVNLLPQPYMYKVLDPGVFQVTPFNGIAKLHETVCITVIGVKSDVKNFSAIATHDEEDVSVELEYMQEENRFIGRFTPQSIGEYEVKIQQAHINITGSPFVVKVANPEAVTILNEPNAVWPIAKTLSILVKVADAGPGELTCNATSCTSNETCNSQIHVQDHSTYEVILDVDSIGVYNVYVKWAEHIVHPSPFAVSFIDPSQITVKLLDCEQLIFVGKTFNIMVDCRDGGEGGTPELNVYDGDEEVSASSECHDNQDGTYNFEVTVWQSGAYSGRFTCSGQEIGNIGFEVLKLIDPKSITVFGEGVHSAITKVPSTVIVNASEVNLLKHKLLTADCFDPNIDFNVLVLVDDEVETVEREFPTFDIVDNLDGTYCITIVYPHEGSYVLNILYDNQPIYGSPYNITVKAAPNAENCKMFGTSVAKAKAGLGLLVDEPIEVYVDTTNSGQGEISSKAVDPFGHACRVFYSEESSTVHCLKIDPPEVGIYSVEVYWSSVNVPGSPLQFYVVDPAMYLLEDTPLPSNAVIQLNEDLSVYLRPVKVGLLLPVVAVSKLDGAQPALVESELDDSNNHVYHLPSDSAGTYSVKVTVGDIHIRGSPFIYDVIDPNQFTVCGYDNRHALVCEALSFQIHGEPPDRESFSVIAHGPSSDITCDVVGSLDGSHYRTSFVPMEPGSYEVFVECANKHVHGSPFTVNVVDPSKCIIMQTPSQLQIGVKEEVIIKTRGAGMGNLSVKVQEETESQELDITINCLGLDTYSITFNPLHVSNHDVVILWSDFPIPCSPVKLNICDANQCKVYGQSISSKKGNVSEPITLTILTHDGGTAKLNIKASGPTAQYAVSQKEAGECKYEATFTPWEVGVHRIQVYFGNHEVPGSPFTITVDKQIGNNACHATGDGLKKALAGREAQFTIISNDHDLVVDQLKVSVTGVHTQAETSITALGNGCFQVKYIPPTPGAYIARITHIGKEIPGSPFKVNCVPAPDASKCTVTGLSSTSIRVAGNPISFIVNASEAGCGQLRVYVQGPNDYHPQVYVADNGKGCYPVKFDAMKHGKYYVVIAWSENHIPGSPFKLRVYPAPDAKKIKLFGPGLANGSLGDPGEFTIDTREGGVGTLLLRVHGLKDSFKIEAKPIDPAEPRVLRAKYSPTMPGNYTIFVRWSGAHVTGSPFSVMIGPDGPWKTTAFLDKPELYQTVTVGKQHHKKKQSHNEKGKDMGAKKLSKKRFELE